MKKQITSSVIWTIVQSWGMHLTGLATFLILARLLDPAAFGLMAMAAIYIQISTILVDQGLASAVIQKQNLEPEHLDTAFWMSVMFALLLIGLSFLFAAPIARLFKEPGLTLIIKVLSFNFLFTAMNGVQDALMRRNFEFKPLAMRSLTAAVIGGIVGIVLASTGFGVMALVGQQLVTSAVGVAVLWSVSGWRPGFRFSPAHAKEMSSFGVNIIGMRFFDVLGRRSADLLIGYFLGAVALGYYTIAFKTFRIFIDIFTKIVSRVALPAFAAIQSQRDELIRGFGRAIQLSCIAALPSFTLLALLAPEVVPTFFGAKWNPSAPVMQILAVMGLLQTIYIVVRQVLVASGRPSWSFGLIALVTGLSIVGFLLVAERGITAVAWAYSIAGIVSLPVYVTATSRSIGFGASKYIHYLRAPLLGTAALTVAVLAVKLVTASWASDPIIIAAATLTGGLSYLAVVHRVEPQIGKSMKSLLKRKPAKDLQPVTTL